MPRRTKLLPLTAVVVWLLSLAVMAAPTRPLVDKILTAQGTGWEIDAKWPQVKTAASVADRAFNQVMTGSIEEDVSRFKKELQRNGPVSGGHWYLAIDYHVFLNTPRYISVVRSTEGYDGGAHPWHHPVSTLFDFDTARTLTMADFFRPATPWLTALSQYCRGEIRRRTVAASHRPLRSYDEETIRQGAGPQADHFKVFYIEARGLTIIFPEYQVASYADGPQEVAIPTSVLRRWLRPGGPL